MHKNKVVMTGNGVGAREYALMEECNVKSRAYMQDTSFVCDVYLQNCPKSLLFGVFDGHGGSLVSSYLQKHLPLIIKAEYKKNKSNVKASLENAFISINDTIKDTIKKASEMGSTATVGLILFEDSKRVIYVAHLGDSTAYIFDDFSCEKLTKQHRCDNPEEVQRLKQCMSYEGMQEARLLIIESVGYWQSAEPSETLDSHNSELQLTRKYEEYLVVASDGLWDFVQIQKIQKIIKEQIEAGDICKMLIKAAIDSKSMDNVTVLVIKL